MARERAVCPIRHVPYPKPMRWWILWWIFCTAVDMTVGYATDFHFYWPRTGVFVVALVGGAVVIPRIVWRRWDKKHPITPEIAMAVFMRAVQITVHVAKDATREKREKAWLN